MIWGPGSIPSATQICGSKNQVLRWDGPCSAVTCSQLLNMALRLSVIQFAKLENKRNGLGWCIQNFKVPSSPLSTWSCADYDSVGLGWSLRFCTSNQLPGEAEAAGPWTTLLVAEVQIVSKVTSSSKSMSVCLDLLRLELQVLDIISIT